MEVKLRKKNDEREEYEWKGRAGVSEEGVLELVKLETLHTKERVPKETKALDKHILYKGSIFKWYFHFLVHNGNCMLRFLCKEASTVSFNMSL